MKTFGMYPIRNFAVEARGKSPEPSRMQGWSAGIAILILLTCSGVFAEEIHGDCRKIPAPFNPSPVAVVAEINPADQKPQCSVGGHGFLVYGLELGSGVLVLLVLVFLVVISKGRKTGRVLRNAQENFRSLVKNVNEGIVVSCGREIDIVFANAKSSDILGYAVDEFIKLPISGIFHPDELERIYRYRNDRYEDPDSSPIFYQSRLIHKDGHTVPVEVSISLTLWEGQKAVITSFHDITERKEAEEQLRRSEERFREIFEGSRDGYSVVDTNARFLAVNTTFCNMLGYTPDELQKVSFYDITPEKWHRWEHEEIWENRLLKNGYSDLYEKEYIRKDGSVFPIEVQAYVVRNEENEVQYLWAVVRDITERKRAETELRFRAMLLDSISDHVTATDLEGRITYVNRAVCENLGMSRNELIGKSVEIYGEDVDKSISQREIVEATRKYGKWQGEIINFTSDGKHIVVDCQTWLLRDAEGKPTGMCGISRNVTERKQTDAEISRLATVIEQAAVTIVITDLEGDIVYTNPDFEISTGYTPSEVLGENPRILKSDHPSQDEAFYQELWDTITAGRTWNGVFVNKRKDGNLYHEQATIFPIKDASGEIINYAAVKRDVTERVRAEEQLRKSEEKAHALLNATADVAMLLKPDGTFVAMNGSTAKRFGLAPEELVGKSAFNLGPPQVAKKRWDMFQKVISSKQPVRFEDENWDICFDNSAYPILDDDGNVQLVAVFAHDITKRKNIEQKLLEHQKKLRSLAQQLAKAEEYQRRKIASGLHDNVVQNLAAVKISASMLHDLVDSQEFRSEMEGMLRVLDETIYETRTLTFELCPPILHNLGFAAAAEWLVEEFGKHHKINTEFKSLTETARCDMSENLRDLMFQLLREILTNVAKHAKASNVKVVISSCDGKYITSVEDDGNGFDVSSVMSRSGIMKGFGLFNIRERLGHFEGRLDIDSTQGKGTKITISLPTQQQGDAT